MRRPLVLKRAMQFGLALALSATLLRGSSAGPADALAGKIPGQETAEQAYRELASKDYQGAIQDFRIALAANLSNVVWRKDLAHAYMAAGSMEQAAAELQNVFRESPDDLRTALELGYLLQQLGHDDAAIQYFTEAARSEDAQIAAPAGNALANLRASKTQARRQKAYDLLTQGRRSDAIKLFEAAREEDPADATATLQLGYLYAASGEALKARQMFASERDNPDPAVAAQARAALDQIHRDSKFWFASLYAAPFYQSRFANEINPSNARIGFRLDRYFQPYIGMRFTRDLRSGTGALSQIFSDNSAVFSAGMQIPLPGTGTMLYAEAGTAINLLRQPNQAAAVPDYRAGLTWYKAWGVGLDQAARANHRFTLTGSGYADVSFYSRYADNVIGSLQLHEGLNLPTARVVPLQLLGTANFIKDSNGDFYNNIIEVGPALRMAPLRNLRSFAIEAQYLFGFYATHVATNPYRPRYQDFRVFLIWARSF